MESSDDEKPLAQINKKAKRKVEDDDDDFDAPSRKSRPKPTKSYVEESDFDADSDDDAFEEPDSKKVPTTSFQSSSSVNSRSLMSFFMPEVKCFDSTPLLLFYRVERRFSKP